MQELNVDLHIHSPHSIAVSKSLNLDTMLETCKKKGLNVLGTGDILQPTWLKYMQDNLKKDKDGAFSYKGMYFILQTEIEDEKNIHHLIFFPNYASVQELQKKFKPHSKNLLGDWGGRPRVNLSPPELVEMTIDSGAIIGPSHAFTPFKAIFRQNTFRTLKDCYESATKNVHFLELGLSANTDLADRMDCLKNISFLSNSDAHSQGPQALGREFNKFEIDNASFEEILLGIRRKEGRKITLNIGLHPKLGKYYNMFCGQCRRRILFKKVKKKSEFGFTQYSITKSFVFFYSDDPESARADFINQVDKNKMTCPACKEEKGKNFKMKLGVSERIDVISTSKKAIHPNHRPPYINAVPLINIIRSVKGIKSQTSKTVIKAYNGIIEELGIEFNILLNTPIERIAEFDEKIAALIMAFRNDEIKYIPGGGGTFGEINLKME